MSEDDTPEEQEQHTLNRRTMLSALGVGAGATFAVSRWGQNGRPLLAGNGRANALSVQETCEPCIDVYSGWLEVQPVMTGAEAPAGETETPGDETAMPGNETATPTNETAMLGNETETPGNETVLPANETETPANETVMPANETATPTNETDTPGGAGGTPGNETATPADATPGETVVPDAESVLDPVLTVEARVTDADVVFVDDGEAEEGTPDGTPEDTPDGAADETPTETIDETPTETPEETPDATPEETPDDEGGGPPGDGGDGEGQGDGGGRGEGEGDGRGDGEGDGRGDGEGEGEDEGMGPGPEGAFPDFYFDPVGIRLRPGDVVAFRNVEDFHTVTAYHPRIFGNQRRVPEGVVGFSSPVMFPDDTWYYRFDEPGVYDMHCLPHEQLGMVVRAVVVEEGGDAPSAYEDAPEDQPSPSEIAQRVLDAPELEPQNIVDQDEVAWTDLTEVESDPPF